MASIAKDPDGRKRIIFKHKTGKRKVIWLGKASTVHAEKVKVRIERIK